VSERHAGSVAASAAALITLVYLLPFRGYGLNLDDEGTLLYQIQRVVHGELPYVDFTTGYTPGFFYLSAGLWRLAGDLPTFRALLALIHAGVAVGIVLLAGRVASRPLALLVGLLYVTFIPVFPGEFCAFNIPYPAWLATLAWVATVLALTTFVRRRGRAWLVAAGLGAAAAFATKPNAGIFAIAAAAAVVLLVESPGTVRARSAWLWYGLWSGVLAGAWVTFGVWPGARDALAYLVPLTAAMLALPTPARVHRAGLAADVMALLGSFLVATLPWIVFFWARLGTEGFLRDVLLLGSGAAQLYYVPYPAFEPWALLVTAVAACVVAAGLGLRAGWIRPWPLALAALAGLALSGLAITRVGLMPERTLWSVIWQLESAGFPLALATHVAGVVWLWRRRPASGCELPAALLLCALFMHLQLYPRADFMHLVTAVPLTAVFAAFLLARVVGWWQAGLVAGGAPGVARGVGPAILAVLAGVLTLRVFPSLASLHAGPQVTLPFAVAPVGVERERAGDLADLGAAATTVASLVPPGGASLAFPAADVTLFLSGARNPTPYAYFFPGRPDHREEAEVVDALASAPPRALVSLNRGLTFFDSAPPYYLLLRRFVRARYVLLERHGRFDVLALAPAAVVAPSPERVPAGGAALAALRGRPLRAAAPALLALATGDDPVERRAALGVIGDGLAADPAQGLETYVAAAGLDRRREVLLLRTIRDVREAGAASYLFAAAARPDPRVANEALGAMYVTRAQLIARRALWAGAEETAAWPGRKGLTAAVRAALADPVAPPRAAAFAAYLVGALRDRDAVPLLRARLGSADPATAASAADALARLAPVGLACDLTALLARPDLELVATVPTGLLGLAEQDEPIGSEARACLARTMATPGPGREAAIWVAAALADGQLASELRAALAADVPAVRRAAAWTLGELPSEAATGQALATAATGDADAIVRRLATHALAKQDGRVPRAALAAKPVDRSAL
jgi:hypothetical protein